MGVSTIYTKAHQWWKANCYREDVYTCSDCRFFTAKPNGGGYGNCKLMEQAGAYSEVVDHGSCKRLVGWWEEPTKELMPALALTV